MTRPSVEWEDRSSHDLIAVPPPGELADLMASVLEAEGASGSASAGLHLVDEAEITELNETHLGGEGATDVLSFPIDGVDPAAAAADGDEVTQLVGDVLVCPAVAARQAPSHAGSMADECRLLVVHGSLHLAGWDHGDPRERDGMWNRERELMERFGVTPALDPWIQS